MQAKSIAECSRRNILQYFRPSLKILVLFNFEWPFLHRFYCTPFYNIFSMCPRDHRIICACLYYPGQYAICMPPVGRYWEAPSSDKIFLIRACSSHTLLYWFIQGRNTLKFSLVCSSTLRVSTSKGQACKWNWFPVSQTSNGPYKMRIRAVSSGLYVIKVLWLSCSYRSDLGFRCQHQCRLLREKRSITHVCRLLFFLKTIEASSANRQWNRNQNAPHEYHSQNEIGIKIQKKQKIITVKPV